SRAAGDDDGRARLLDRSGGEVRFAQVVGAAVVAEGILAPQAGDYLQLLLHQVDSSRRRREVEAVGDVLGLQPAGAHTQLGATVTQVVQRGGHLGEHRRVAERDRADERAEADPLGFTGEPGEVDPRVGGDVRAVAASVEV